MIFEISTAIGCPIDCLICPQRKIEAAYAGPRLMSMETFNECLPKIPKGAFVSFAGFAEPYLNPHCTEMILATIAAGFEVMLYTTCVGMTLEDVKRIAGVKFKILCLHLPDADENAKIHLTPTYLDVVKAMADAFPGAQMMTMGRLHPAVEYLASRVKGTHLHTRAGNVEGKPIPIRKRGRIQCTQNAEQKDNVLLPDGSLALCCNDYSLQHVIGNLVNQGYDEIFEGEAYKTIRAGMLDGSDLLCRTCEFSAAF